MPRMLAPVFILVAVAAAGALATDAALPTEPAMDTVAAQAAQARTIGPFAFAAATSEAMHRVFVVSSYLDNRNGGVTGEGRVCILDSRTGRMLQRVVVGRGADDVVIDDRTGHAFVAGRGEMIWYRQGNLNVYKATGTSLTMLDTATGRVLRRISWGEQAPVSLVLSASTSRLFVNTDRLPDHWTPTLHAIDTRSGNEVQTKPGNQLGTPTEVLDSVQRVFTGATGGTHVRDARSWKLLKKVPVSSVAMASDEIRSRMVMLIRKGRSVTMMDGRTGHLLRSLSLPGGRAGWRVAVDAKTGHLFVVNRATYGSTGSPRGGWVMTIDAAAERVLHTVHVGSNTHDVVVDTRAGHALVLSAWTNKSGVFGDVTLINTRTGALVRNVPLLTSYLVSALTLDTGSSRIFAIGARQNTTRPTVDEMQKAANSVAVLDSRTGALLRVVDLSAG